MKSLYGTSTSSVAGQSRLLLDFQFRPCGYFIVQQVIIACMTGSLIRFEIPYQIEVPDGIRTEGPVFHPYVSGFPIGLAFEKSTGDAGLDSSMEIKRDRLGKATRSKVQASITPDHANSLPRGGVTAVPGAIAMVGSPLDDHEGRMIKEAVAGLNKFLAHYRHLVGYHWIRHLTPEDILKFEIKTDDRGFRERTVIGGPMEFGGDPRFQPEHAEALQEALVNNRPPNLYLNMHLDVLDRIDIGYNRIATILSYLLFETWIKNVFVEALQNKGMSLSKARELITDEDGQYDDIKNILSNHCAHHLDVDFNKYDRYDDWQESLYELRQKVVHEGYRPGKSEVKQAHRETVQAIEFFQNKLGELISDKKTGVSFIQIKESPDAKRHR